MVNLTFRCLALLTFFTQGVSDDPIKPLKSVTTLKRCKIKAIKFPFCLFLCLFSSCFYVQCVKTILECHLLIGRCVIHLNKPLTVPLKTLFSFCFITFLKKEPLYQLQLAARGLGICSNLRLVTAFNSIRID